jgi:hypothetical protein
MTYRARLWLWRLALAAAFFVPEMPALSQSIALNALVHVTAYGAIYLLSVQLGALSRRDVRVATIRDAIHLVQREQHATSHKTPR